MCPRDVAVGIPSVSSLKVVHSGPAIPELFQNAGSVTGKFWVYVPIISVAMVMQEGHTFCKRRHSGLGHNPNLNCF